MFSSLRSASPQQILGCLLPLQAFSRLRLPAACMVALPAWEQHVHTRRLRRAVATHGQTEGFAQWAPALPLCLPAAERNRLTQLKLVLSVQVYKYHDFPARSHAPVRSQLSTAQPPSPPPAKKGHGGHTAGRWPCFRVDLGAETVPGDQEGSVVLGVTLQCQAACQRV